MPVIPYLSHGAGNARSITNLFASPRRAGSPAPRRRRVSLTAEQVANRRVNAQLNPLLAQQDAYAQRQNETIKQFASALLGRLQPIGDQVGQDYDRAIGQTAALAGGAAQFLDRQNPNASQQGLLAAVGAPQEQMAQQQQMLGDVYGGGAGALMFTGGVVPGSQLASDKAGAQAFARSLPGIAALKGEQDLLAALGQQREDRNALLAKRPALFADELDRIHDNNAARAKAQLDERNFQLDQRIAAASLGFKYDTLASNERVAQAKINARQQEVRTRYQHDLAMERQRYQRDLDLAKQKYANSAQTREDEQRFKAAQQRAKDRFTAKQKQLDRQSRERIARIRGKGKTSKSGAKSSLVP